MNARLLRTSIETLAKELDRYGAIEKIDYIRGGDHAYATFVSTEAAVEACLGMKGFPLGGREHRIRVDFSASPDALDGAGEADGRKRRSLSQPGLSPAAKAPRPRPPGPGPGPRTPPDSPPGSPRGPIFTAASLADLHAAASPAWTGALILKKSSYAIRFYQLRGSPDLIQSLLCDPVPKLLSL